MLKRINCPISCYCHLKYQQKQPKALLACLSYTNRLRLLPDGSSWRRRGAVWPKGPGAQLGCTRSRTHIHTVTPDLTLGPLRVRAGAYCQQLRPTIVTFSSSHPHVNSSSQTSYHPHGTKAEVMDVDVSWSSPLRIHCLWSCVRLISHTEAATGLLGQRPPGRACNGMGKKRKWKNESKRKAV